MAVQTGTCPDWPSNVGRTSIDLVERKRRNAIVDARASIAVTSAAREPAAW